MTTLGNAALKLVQVSDQELVERARNADPRAFEQLVERHQSRAYGLAVRMLKDPAAAEEVLQEAFFAAWQRLPGFRAEAAFGSWIHRIVANRCLMRLRHANLEREKGLVTDGPSFDASGTLLEHPSPDWTAEADKQVMDHELREAIEQAVSALPDEYRAVFLLKDVEGLSYEEIGETLELTMATVKSRLHRARLALRSAIEGFYADTRGRRLARPGLRLVTAA